MLRGIRSFRFSSLVLGGVPAESKGTAWGLLASAVDKAEGPAVATEEFSFRGGSSGVRSICKAPELDGSRECAVDWPGTGEDSLMVDTCLLCDLDTEPDREPAIELESSRCLMSRGRSDMIGYPNSQMQVSVRMVARSDGGREYAGSSDSA